MPEQIKNILDRIKEWWNRFTTRQKTLIVVVAAAAVMTLIILVTVLTQPNYSYLVTAETPAEASTIRDLLQENSISYQIADDAVTFKVLDKQVIDARLLLAANGVQAADYTIDAATNSSFSTTESDKQKKYVAYLENKLTSDLKTIETIDNCRITLHVPSDDGTLIASKEKPTASVILQLNDPEKFTDDNAAYVAKIVATALGNDSTQNVTILDTSGNMLFTGESDDSMGTASTQLTLKQKMEKYIEGQVKSVILGTNLYDNVEVAPNLSMDFSSIEDTNHTYTPVDGGSQGVLSHEENYKQSTSGGETGVPGTDTNDDTTYVTEDRDNYQSSTSENAKDYLPNERITNTHTPPGKINTEDSSISVSAINYIVIKQEDYKPDEHDGQSWAEYKASHTAPVDVTDTIDSATLIRLQNLVSTATGISNENITVALCDENVYFDSEGLNISVTDVLQILLILVILGLLAFVILRSLRAERQEEVEEEPQELSVEQLLESQAAEHEMLGDIEIDEGSETKKLIEQFIESNPEAAANLLRNWLNEDFGM
ncbi:flagellar basal-body MS-ring/collar protein FliF [Butyrivibrio sp. MC2013]|uniref:flagellar basal-body MS-ring/collar protein FliF n=1 Tax=Butyrivibrio sp. MC2013 TaxID=1280686 RepID=UPI0003FA651D|nr:flagellar basal-body MS-ring/collar protein FliF [Butyrivibrio sp. MC2013]